MKSTLKNWLLAALIAIFAVCLAVGVASCTKTTTEHNFSSEWSYDDTAHWHACTDDGCDEVADYEEHIPTDEGDVIGSYVYYTCEVCGYEYRSDLYTYVVYVKNIGGAGVSGVTVTLYDSANTYVSEAVSSTGGTVRFRNLAKGSYTAKVDRDTLPVGYSGDSDDLTVEFTADYRAATVYLTPHLITSSEATEPSGISYSLGDIVYDHTFTVYYHDGSTGTVTFSELLANYDAIMLQFFYTTCSPCLQEFPYINEVYNTYTASDGSYYYEKIAILEVAYTYYDSLGYFQSFVTSNLGYDNFAYAYDTESYYSNHGVIAFPTTLIIDRYGVICSWDDGSQANHSYWVNLFETYIGDDYTPDYVTSSSSDDDSTTTATKPDVDMPESGEIANTIVTENAYTTIDGNEASDTGTFEFSAYSENGVLDEYSWPWLINEDEDAEIYGVTNYIYSSNSNRLGTYSILVIDVKLEAGQVFMFDYVLSTEADNDILYIQVDTVLQAQLSGETTAWDTFYYVAQYSGYYQITLLYQKNTSIDEAEDRVYVTNMRIGVLDMAATETDTANDILDTTTAITTPDMLYNAATAYTTDGTQSSYYAGTGYKNYVSVYLASDGWYRVDLDGDNQDDDDADEDDPYLLADLYYTTPWNSTYAIWTIAYVYLYTYDYTSTDESTDDPISGKGILYNNEAYNSLIEDYAWIQNVAPLGYTLVNSELAQVIKEVTASYGTTTQADNENQWLEVCRYYIHYGAESESHECKSLENLNATYGAIMAEDTGVTLSDADTTGTLIVHAEMPEVINPRGFYYSFTVETEGVYLIYTDEPLHDANGYEADGETYGNNPYIWITDGTGHEIAENDNYDLTVYDADGNINNSSTLTAYYDDNAYVYCYLEAGTYLIGCSLSYIYDTGDYNIYGQYLGATYTYLTAAVTSDIYTYRYDEATETYTYYLPTVFSSYYLDVDDNCYYAYNDDGTLTPIYINMCGITYLNSSYSTYTIEQAIENGSWSGTSDTRMRYYLSLAKSNDGYSADGQSMYGYTQATAELVALLNVYINGGDTEDDSTYSGNAWMLTAYYQRTLNTYSASAYTVTDEIE